jgi:hypothetical protein
VDYKKLKDFVEIYKQWQSLDSTYSSITIDWNEGIGNLKLSFYRAGPGFTYFSSFDEGVAFINQLLVDMTPAGKKEILSRKREELIDDISHQKTRLLQVNKELKALDKLLK